MPRSVSRVTIPDLDFERDGKQVTWARLPYSSNISAYGWIPVPIAVIRNGEGPTLLLSAGVHGDEYEGQVAITKLIRTLEPSQIRGRIIAVTTMNQPAAAAGTRVSPIDDLNMNRVFPGERNGTPTLALAHFAEAVLLPMADCVLDLHSGGRTLDYVPAVLCHVSGDAALDERTLELLRVFGAPYGYVMTQPVDEGTFLGAAGRSRTPMLGTELGGAGRVGRDALAVGERGIRNVMAHLGMLPGVAPGEPTGPVVEVGDHQDYAYAPDRGIFEYLVLPGEEVGAGEPIGILHFVDDPLRPPIEVRAIRDGLMLAKRHPGPCERGDCLAQLGRPYPA